MSLGSGNTCSGVAEGGAARASVRGSGRESEVQEAGRGKFSP